VPILGFVWLQRAYVLSVNYATDKGMCTLVVSKDREVWFSGMKSHIRKSFAGRITYKKLFHKYTLCATKAETAEAKTETETPGSETASYPRVQKRQQTTGRHYRVLPCEASTE
jgi:hypothetical protein